MNSKETPPTDDKDHLFWLNFVQRVQRENIDYELGRAKLKSMRDSRKDLMDKLENEALKLKSNPSYTETIRSKARPIDWPIEIARIHNRLRRIEVEYHIAEQDYLQLAKYFDD